MTNKDAIELINTGFVKPEFVKNVTHFFCRLVMDEGENDPVKGYARLRDRLLSWTASNAEGTGIRPITGFFTLLECFFNQKNEIPANVYHWLYAYCTRYGSPSEYTYRHYDVYSALQRECIQHHRLTKQDNKDMADFEKQRRRQLCRLYKSGEYSTTFAMYGKPLDKIVDAATMEKIKDMLIDLFGKAQPSAPVDDEFAAIAYCLGRMQGRHDITTNTAAAV